ncbi:unnamed protein product [Polarella glacialis]|uniref:Uncharacterized protein n=1 Tax=Polarella glacialis TaxID=89957 RepID=A0A813ENE4_POLGL|nr:unnamed protein product [Polarella glacialis]
MRVADEVLADQKLECLVRWGEVRAHEGVKLWRQRQALKRNLSRLQHLEAETGVNGGSSSSSQNLATQMEEVQFQRSVDSLLEGYRRLSRPEKVGQTWASERWVVVAQFMAKLRTVASLSNWRLPPPARHLSRDPRALADTAMEDATLAAQTIDAAEGLVDARLIRVAVRLMEQVTSAKASAGLQWLSPESRTLARIVLTHLRSTCTATDRLMEGEEVREIVLSALSEAYGALAAGLACLRKRIGEESHQMLHLMQDPLKAAARSAASLGLIDKSRALNLSSEKAAFKSNGDVPAGGDTFMPLHQATLLTSISSFAEVSNAVLGGGGSKGIAEARVKRLLESVLSGRPLGGEQDLGKADSEHGGKDEGSDFGERRVEFTASQLRMMRKALKSRDPNVEGALALLHDALCSYEKIAEALGKAYQDERALNANPAEIARHKALVELGSKFRSAWRDAGTVLIPSRQADLLALESVRLRHHRLVLRAFRAGGFEVAVVVLARLALVDEMMLPPSKRLITGEVPFSQKRPYELCQAVLSCMQFSGVVTSRRRRRWLRCPHAVTQLILCGEVWTQVMGRFLNADLAFDPLKGCSDIPLNLREFRLAAGFLELQLQERPATLLYEHVADNTPGGSGEATLYALQKMIMRDGSRASGDFGYAAAAAAAEVRNLLAAAAEREEKAPQMRRASFSTAPMAGAKLAQLAEMMALDSSANLPERVPMVCHRCVRGELPNFPHVSVGELNRNFCAGLAENGDDHLLDQSCASTMRASHTSKSSNQSCGSSFGSSDSDSDAMEDLSKTTFDDPAEQELGEDAIVSWATSVLADGVLLCKDERGAYFRWLSRVVLYSYKEDDVDDKVNADVKPGTAEGTSKSRASVTNLPMSGNARRLSWSKASSGFGARRMSLSSAYAAVIPSSAEEVPDPKPQGQTMASSPNKPSTADRAQLRERRRADEKREAAETLRDSKLTMPDPLLRCMRFDLGLSLPPKQDDLGLETLATRERRMKLSEHLLQNYKENQRTVGSEAQKLRRSEREAKMLSGLHFFSVREKEVKVLEKELVASSELASGMKPLLAGSAAARAQYILVPNLSVREPLSRGTGQDLHALALSHVLRTFKASAGPGQAALEDVGRLAQEIIACSSTNAANCYSRSGFEEEARKCDVAAALRVLEKALYPSSSESVSAAVELVASVVPLLLPKKAAQKLIQQSKWEEEVAVLEDTGGTGGIPLAIAVERRKARVQDCEERDAYETSSDFTSSAGGQSGHRRSRSDPKSSAAARFGHGQSPPTAPTSRLSTPVKPQTPMSDFQHVPGISDSGLGALKSEAPRGTETQQSREEVQQPTAIEGWHPSVLSLLASVDVGGKRVRHTTRGAFFQKEGSLRAGLARSYSDTSVARLPYVANAKTTGSKATGAKAPRILMPDAPVIEGRQVSLATAPVGHSLVRVPAAIAASVDSLILLAHPEITGPPS